MSAQLGQLVSIATAAHAERLRQEQDVGAVGVSSIVTNADTLKSLFEATFIDAPVTVVAQRVGSVLVLDVDSGIAFMPQHQQLVRSPQLALPPPQQQLTPSADSGSSSPPPSRDNSSCFAAGAAAGVGASPADELGNGTPVPQSQPRGHQSLFSMDRSDSTASLGGAPCHTMTVDLSRLMQGNGGGNGPNSPLLSGSNGNGGRAVCVALDDLLAHCCCPPPLATTTTSAAQMKAEQQSVRPSKAGSTANNGNSNGNGNGSKAGSPTGGVPGFFMMQPQQAGVGAGHAAAAADLVRRSPVMRASGAVALPRTGSSSADDLLAPPRRGSSSAFSSKSVSPVVSTPAAAHASAVAGHFPPAAVADAAAALRGGGTETAAAASAAPQSSAAAAGDVDAATTTNVVRWKFGGLDVLLSVDGQLMQTMESFLALSTANSNISSSGGGGMHAAERGPRSAAEHDDGDAVTEGERGSSSSRHDGRGPRTTAAAADAVASSDPKYSSSHASDGDEAGDDDSHRPRFPPPSASVLSTASAYSVRLDSSQLSSASPGTRSPLLTPTSAGSQQPVPPQQQCTLSRRTALDAWFDTMISASSAVAVCVHNRGAGQQEYHVMPASSGQFGGGAGLQLFGELGRQQVAVNALQTAGNVFNWLLQNCTTQHGSYVITRKAGSAELMLFEITDTAVTAAAASAAAAGGVAASATGAGVGAAGAGAVGARDASVEEVDSDDSDDKNNAPHASTAKHHQQQQQRNQMQVAVAGSEQHHGGGGASAAPLEAVQGAVAILCMRMAQNILTARGQEDQVLSLLVRCAELDKRNNGRAPTAAAAAAEAAPGQHAGHSSLRAHAVALIPQVVRRRCLRDATAAAVTTVTNMVAQQGLPPPEPLKAAFAEGCLRAVRTAHEWMRRMEGELGAQSQSRAEMAAIAMGLCIKVLSDIFAICTAAAKRRAVQQLKKQQQQQLDGAADDGGTAPPPLQMERPDACPTLRPVAAAATQCLVEAARLLEDQVERLTQLRAAAAAAAAAPTSDVPGGNNNAATLAEGWLSCLRELTADCCVLAMHYPILFDVLQEVVGASAAQPADTAKTAAGQQPQHPALYRPFTVTFSHSRFDLARLCFVALQSYKHCTIGRDGGVLARKTAQVSYVMGVQHLRSGRFTKAAEHLRAALSECAGQDARSYSDDNEENAADGSDQQQQQQQQQQRDREGDGAQHDAGADKGSSSSSSWWWDFRGVVLRCDEAHVLAALGDAARKRAELEQAGRGGQCAVTDREMDAWREAVNRYQSAIEFCFAKAGIYKQQQQRQQDNNSNSKEETPNSSFSSTQQNHQQQQQQQQHNPLLSGPTNEFVLFEQSGDALPPATRTLVHETRLLLLQTSLIYANRVASALSFCRQECIAAHSAPREQQPLLQSRQAWFQDVRDVTRHVQDIVASALRRISASSAVKHARSNAETLRLLSHALRCQYVPPAFAAAVLANLRSCAKKACGCVPTAAAAADEAEILLSRPMTFECGGRGPPEIVVAARVACICYVIRGWKCLSLTWDADDVELDSIRCSDPASLTPQQRADCLRRFGGSNRERDLLRFLRVPPEEDTATRLLFLTCVMELDVTYNRNSECMLMHTWICRHFQPVCELLHGTDAAEQALLTAAGATEGAGAATAGGDPQKRLSDAVDGILRRLPLQCEVGVAAVDILERLVAKRPTPPPPTSGAAGAPSAQHAALVARRKLITAFCRSMLNYAALVGARLHNNQGNGNGGCGDLGGNGNGNGACGNQAAGLERIRDLATQVLKTPDNSAVVLEHVQQFKTWMLRAREEEKPKKK